MHRSELRCCLQQHSCKEMAIQATFVSNVLFLHQSEVHLPSVAVKDSLLALVSHVKSCKAKTWFLQDWQRMWNTQEGLLFQGDQTSSC